MHELSIALNLLDIAVEESERYGGANVEAIHIKLGPLSGVVRAALESAFDLARESSPFADCRLVIEEVPVTCYCATCGQTRDVQSVQQMSCSHCGNPATELRSGSELEIAAMEIEHLPDAEAVEPGGARRGVRC